MRAECSEQMEILRRRYGRSYEQPTAIPMLTDAYNLPAKKGIHIVGRLSAGSLRINMKKNWRNAMKTYWICVLKMA